MTRGLKGVGGGGVEGGGTRSIVPVYRRAKEKRLPTSKWREKKTPSTKHYFLERGGYIMGRKRTSSEEN